MSEQPQSTGKSFAEIQATKVTTPEFRASFVTAFEPKAYKGGNPKYSIVMLFDKTLAKQGKLNDLQNLIKTTAIEKWGEIPPEVTKIGSEYCPFKDGNEKDYEGYENTYTVTASSLYPPAIVDTGDANKGIKPQAIIDPKEFYSGCYARASVIAFTWESKGQRGVSLGLQNIQKLADGEPFSGRGNPEADFDPIIPEKVEVADTNDLFGDMSETKKDNLEGL